MKLVVEQRPWARGASSDKVQVLIWFNAVRPMPRRLYRNKAVQFDETEHRRNILKSSRKQLL